MHQELDAHCLPRKWRHIHLRIDKSARLITHVEDRLQDLAIAVGDVSVLPIKRNRVSGAVLVPEAQSTLTSWNCELLIEGAVALRLGPTAADWVAAGGTTHDCGISATMRVGVGDERRGIGAVNCPVGQVTGLKSAVLDYPSVTRCRRRRWSSCRRRCRRWGSPLSAWEYPHIINVFFVLSPLWIEVKSGRIRHIAT